MIEKLGYQPHIDGLRAIAVGMVVVYHFAPSWLPGGFLGVDVFFVISGYLITRLIRDDIKAGTFSFARFYARRARRLFPALFVTVVAAFLIALFALSGKGQDEALDSLFAALTSISNIYFWQLSGYFEGGSLSKPLLHTWSLSVEEQFYLVWPFLMVLTARKLGINALAAMAAGVAVLSLVLCHLFLRNEAEMVFFFTPFRAFEFMVGALLVFVVDRWKANNVLMEVVTVAGLLAVVASGFIFTDLTPMPGILSLVPCVGAALLIGFGKAPIFGKVLSNPVFVWVGRISYSVYLVHWLVAVLFDFITFREPSPMEVFLLIAITLALALPMYFFVEQKFRHAKGPLSSPLATGFVCTGAIAVLLVPVLLAKPKIVDEVMDVGSAILSVGVGLISSPVYAQEAGAKFSDEALDGLQRERGNIIRDMKCGEPGTLCGRVSADKTNAVIVGDSIVVDALNSLSTGYPDVNFLLLRADGCAPWGNSADDKEDCTSVNELRAQEMAKLADVKYVVIALAIRQSRIDGLLQYISDLAADGKHVIVLGMGNHYKRPAVEAYKRLASDTNPRPSLAEFQIDAPYAFDEQVKAAVAAVQGTFLDRKPLFCSSSPCSDYTADQSALVIVDSLHQTWASSLALGQYFAQTYPALFQ